MAFGDLVSAYGRATGNEMVDFGGQVFNYMADEANFKQANAERQQAFAFQNEIQKQQLRMQAQEQADQVAMRNRLLSQSQNLADAIGGIYDYLGLPPVVDARQVVGDYLNLRQNAYGDLDRLVTMVSSSNRAKNMSRGVGESTVQDMAEQEIVRKYYPEYQKADQAAYDAAIARNASMQDLYNANRESIVNSVKDRYGSQFSAESSLFNNNYAPNRASYQPTALSQANTGVQSASRKFGNTAGEVGERIEGGAYDELFRKFAGLFGDGEEEVQEAPV